jgi:FkbM family methyltransferase
MPWTQYARNLEDVMLVRALAGVSEGSFLDVGASHPIHDSTTYALYQRGWRGIALEPIEEIAALWPRERPEDLLIAMAASGRAGERTLHMTPHAPQISTLDARQAADWQRQGYHVVPRGVPATTLNEVLDRLQEGELHLMSLDVEGSEADVLAGLDLGRHRPWIVVIEAIHPGTALSTHEAWEPGVLAAGYEFVYFDGCNRFYVAGEHGELRRHFATPPGPADDFVRNPGEHYYLAPARG